MRKMQEKRLAFICIVALLAVAVIFYIAMQWEDWASIVFFGFTGFFFFCKAVLRFSKKTWKIPLLLLMLSLLFLIISATWTAENIGSSSQVQDFMYNAILVIGGCGITSLLIVAIATLIEKLR